MFRIINFIILSRTQKPKAIHSKKRRVGLPAFSLAATLVVALAVSGGTIVPDVWTPSDDAASAEILPGYAFAQSSKLNLVTADSIDDTGAAERPVDVLVYGYDEDGRGPISAGHLALLESRGYVVKGNNGPADPDEMKDAKVVIGWRIGPPKDKSITMALEEYVYEGGRLLMLTDTNYQSCTPGSENKPCHLDFTKDAFGFKLDGSVQYSTIYPAPGQEGHPIWNVPHKVTEFSDWCCDAYVEEIIDQDNITVLSTVSGQSYKPTGYHTVQNVPAIIINDNPDWNGGMVMSAGLNMIIGWHGPDTRLFENVLLFMLDETTDVRDFEDLMSGADTPQESTDTSTNDVLDWAERPVDVLVYGYDEDGRGPISAGHLALLESRGYVVKGNNGPADPDEMKDAKVVIGWRIGPPKDKSITMALEEYVYEGGRLLMLTDTNYQSCTPGSENKPCHLDFTKDAFGFKLDGSVQYSTIYPAPGQEGHPIWNVPHKVTEFSDWCCDAYVEEIIDQDNITVLSTVSGQSYKPTGYHTVQNVPAIIINDNPDWNGGMVMSAGLNMIIGWHGPDTRLYENVLLFMLDETTDVRDFEDLMSGADTPQESTDTSTNDELGDLIRQELEELDLDQLQQELEELDLDQLQQELEELDLDQLQQELEELDPSEDIRQDTGGCLIATAAYGSELAPQVQFLREIRDNTLLSTASGTSFMTGFNQAYYFFSPAIADLERENPVFRYMVRAAITPAMYTMNIMTFADPGSDASVLVFGMLSIGIIGGMYVAGPYLAARAVIRKARQRSGN